MILCPINMVTMMLPTHALVGMALAMAFGFVTSDFAGAAFLGGLLGGILPDLDMYAGHRRTLHYPVYYSVAAVPAMALALTLPAAGTVFVALFLVAASAHSVSDVFGAGLELRPWEATSDRAVYDHYNGRWVPARRWIPYDGSPVDLLVALSMAVPLSVTLDGLFQSVVLFFVAVGVLYTTLRRVLPEVAVTVVNSVLRPHLQDQWFEYVPSRYLDADGGRLSVGNVDERP